MPIINPPTPVQPVKVRDLLSNAAIEARWLAQGEVLTPEDSKFLLSKLNDMLDEWAAREVYAYNVNFSLYNLTPNLSPHTIGPQGATFNVSQRPVRVEGATIVLTGTTPTTELPLSLRDDEWWKNQRVKNLTSTIPTDLYYSPDWPNGSLYFWPVPNFAYQVRLELWGLITGFGSINDTFSMPPGYRKALTLSLAQELDGPRSADPMLANAAAKARKAVQGNNQVSPRIATQDFGMPSRTKHQSGFNYLTGDLTR